MWERNSLHALMIEGTMDSPKFNDFGAVSKQQGLGLSLLCRYAEWFSVPRYVGGVSHGYLILEEEGSNGTPFQQDEVLPHFHVAVHCLLD